MDEVEKLIERLQNGHYWEVEKAAEKLGELKDLRAIGPLIGEWSHSNPDVCDRIREALLKFGGPAIKPLAAALENKDWKIRGEAAETLRAMGKPGTEVLLNALENGQLETRSDAANALMENGRPVLVEALVERSRNSNNPQLRFEISRILAKIDEWEKKTEHDLGIREKKVLKVPEIPNQFQRLMLDGKPVKVKG